MIRNRSITKNDARVPLLLFVLTFFIATVIGCDRGKRKDQPPASPQAQQKDKEAGAGEKKKEDSGAGAAGQLRTDQEPGEPGKKGGQQQGQPLAVVPPPQQQQSQQQQRTFEQQRQEQQRQQQLQQQQKQPPQQQGNAQKRGPTVAQLEDSLQLGQARNTFGGQLLVGYLEGRLTGEQVVAETFADHDYMLSNLAEMSLAIQEMRDRGQYTDKDRKNVEVLEAALTQYLHEEVRRSENLERTIDYGSAIALGLIGGIYSDEILRGLGKGLDKLGPAAGGVYKGVRKAPGGLRSWLRSFRGKPADEVRPGATPADSELARRGEAVMNEAAERSAAREAGEVAAAREGDTAAREAAEAAAAREASESAAARAEGAAAREADDAAREAAEATAARRAGDRSLYRRGVGYFKTHGGSLTSEELVVRHIARVMSSPELARGYEVVRVPADRIAEVERLVFHKTGVSGFRIHQREGEDFLTAQIVRNDGGYDYFHVQGNAIKTMTRDGQEVIIPSTTMADMASSRLKNFGEDTISFITESGQRIKTGVRNSRAYQYLANNPRANRILRGTAVGGTIGVLTLLALRPINKTYLTLEEYVEELESEGINLEDFLDQRRREAQTKAGTVNALDIAE